MAAVQNHVGGVEIANFAKHEFKGAGARSYLNYMLGVAASRAFELDPDVDPKGVLWRFDRCLSR